MAFNRCERDAVKLRRSTRSGKARRRGQRASVPCRTGTARPGGLASSTAALMVAALPCPTRLRIGHPDSARCCDLLNASSS